MKFTLSWLRDHLATEASLDEILDKLTVIGLEVEEVVNPAARLGEFTIAKVISAKQHPDADKLRVCEVETGAGVKQVVCGAPNAREGLIGVFAAEGTYIPGTDFTLGKAKIRGVESQGMLCSERELELSDEHEGIIDLPEEAGERIGERYVDVMELDDPAIEIAITPNRPDCLGVRGIARDLAAAGLGKLTPDPVKRAKGEFDCPIPIGLKFAKETADACPAFGGLYVRGVDNTRVNGEDYRFIARRLRAIGLRPVNPLADVTNYVSYDRGRPLHVYDADKLKGAIHARLGKKGETFLALDGDAYEVDDEMCVIADDSGMLGLGGVIGGESTGCTAATRNVLIESAYFDPIRIAMTGRRTGIQSDARYRFERGIDPQSIELGLNFAAQLILRMCGGTPSKIELAGAPPEPKTVIKFDTDEVKRLTGVKFKSPEIKGTLKKLGFGIDGKGEKVKVKVPGWRPDVSQPADLVEEVIRLAGVDKVPAVAMTRDAGVARAVLTEGQKRVRRSRRVLASRGFVEAITWSFNPRAIAKRFGGGPDALELANPISTEMSSMRPSLLAGLLMAAQRNHDRGFAGCALFEVGQAYRGAEPDEQFISTAGVRTGSARLEGAGRHWSGTTDDVDLFAVKADALAVLAALGQNPAKVQVTRDAPDWFHPGQSATLRLGPKIVLGHFGVFHPQILKVLSVSGAAAGFEMDLDALPRSRRKARARPALDIPDLQPVRRDFAFILEQAVPAMDVVRAAQGADKALITDVTIFDLFEGESLGPGKKSLAIEVTLQPRDQTLTDEQIDRVATAVIAAVTKATGGEIRG